MRRFEHRGKVVCVTGASMGIGRATALEFARAGAKVAVTARSTELLDQVVEEIEGMGGEAVPVTADVRFQDQVEEMIRKTEESLGPIDVMLLNAGMNLKKEAADLSIEEWRYHFDVNFWGVLYGVYAVLPGMAKRGSGQMIIVNSIVGRVSLPMVAPYSATKFALTAATDSMRPEFKRLGIDVIGIYPSFVPTNLSNLDSLDRPGIGGGLVKAVMPVVPVERAARIILDASRQRRKEVVFTAAGKILARLAPLAPGVKIAMMEMLYGRIERAAKAIRKHD